MKACDKMQKSLLTSTRMGYGRIVYGVGRSMAGEMKHFCWGFVGVLEVFEGLKKGGWGLGEVH